MAAFVGAGFLLTVLLQSSSAALAIILTSAAGGLIGLHDAAAMVIGANVGTTITALLVVLGATASAKRVAAAHIAFNLITGVVAFAVLPLILNLLEALQSLFGMSAGPATELALFHTVFNILGVLLLWPFSGHLARFLETRFRRGEEDLARPKYLDRTLAATPVLGLQALTRELIRLGEMSRGMAQEAISSERVDPQNLERQRAVTDRLVEAIGDFSNRMQQSNLPPPLAEVLPNALRVSRYHSEMAELAVLVGHSHSLAGDLGPSDIEELVYSFKRRVVRLLVELDRHSVNYPTESCEQNMKDLQEAYQALKSRLLRVGAEGRLPVRRLVDELDTLSNIRRLAEQADKADRYLQTLQEYLTQEHLPSSEIAPEETT
jgi:phosphate:Na+ symporter